MKDFSNELQDIKLVVDPLFIFQRLSHEMHKQMNQTLRKLKYGGSRIQMGTQRFLL